MTAADVGLLDRPTRLIEVIAAIKDLRCAKVGRPGGAVGPLTRCRGETVEDCHLRRDDPRDPPFRQCSRPWIYTPTLKV